LKFDAKGKIASDRFPDIAKGLGVLPRLVEGGTVAIEKPLYFKNPHSTISISEVVGAVKEVLELANISYKTVDNRVWKKEIISMGNASKDDIIKYATKYFDAEFEEQDWADAACIAEWSRRNA
jgi:Holliday junction resolvasome RuvABC endonuclease subunit